MYRNTTRPGLRSTTSVNPKNVMEDISEDIRVLEPEATPLLSLGNIFGTGAAPKSHKVQVREYDAFDHFDYASNMVLGSATDPRYSRFALLTLDQPSRPDIPGVMLYSPQDKLFIGATGQTVEVVMTPTDSLIMSLDGQSRLSLPAALTGGTATTTAAGTVLVRNITSDAPIIPIPARGSDVIYTARTIFESQKIQATPWQRDLIYDCNFVEHKEAVVNMTEDQAKWVKTLGRRPEWDFEQEQTFKDFKKSIEYALIFNERAFDGTVPGRPKRHMRGLYNAIKTNVAVYNPQAVQDFRKLVLNFFVNQGFRYNPNGKNKVIMCGQQFLINFNEAFQDAVRLTGKEKSVGLDIDTLIIPGGYNVKLATTEILRQGTPFENWCFVIDPKEGEHRIVKDFKTRMYANNDERDIKMMIEWQGTIAWHLEQSHALLRTA